MVDSSGGKVKRLGVFMEVLRNRRRFRGIDMRSVDKLDKVECRCSLAP